MQGGAGVMKRGKSHRQIRESPVAPHDNAPGQTPLFERPSHAPCPPLIPCLSRHSQVSVICVILWINNLHWRSSIQRDLVYRFPRLSQIRFSAITRFTVVGRGRLTHETTFTEKSEVAQCSLVSSGQGWGGCRGARGRDRDVRPTSESVVTLMLFTRTDVLVWPFYTSL